ncbi:MAG: hypothetical protein HY958_05115 [Bacteroidia bacterium]|nr:hypothetical protein [Bacteroidia bacterium]
MKKDYSKEENEIITAFKAGSLKKSKNIQDDMITAKKTALNTFARTKQISIKLTEKEIVKLKVKAIEAGLFFQSLIYALIHNYTDNRIQFTFVNK